MSATDRSDSDGIRSLRRIADELKAESGTRFSKYSPEEPSPKQRQFIESDHEEALFGGGVGGGKSSGLLMAYLRDVEKPRYNGLILRKTLGESKLAGGPLQRSKEWFYNTDAVWNEDNKKWTFPSGATLTFAYLDHDDDVYRYQGSEWHFVGFDELTHFSESAYQYMAYERMRRTKAMKAAGVQMRVRATANPEGPYLEWVTRHFVAPGHPSRLYIASTLKDNPGLDVEDYEARLMHLSPERRRRMIDGIWDPEPPATAIWKEDYIRYVTDKELAERKDFRYLITVIALDPAVTSRDSSDATGIVVMSLGSDNKIYVRGDFTGKHTPNETANIAQTIWRMVKSGGGHLRIRYESNQGGDYVAAMLKPSFDPTDELGLVKGVPSTMSKEARAYPVAGQYERGNIIHVVKAREEFDGTIKIHNHLKELEREMLFWNPVLDKRKSPNRLDALVIGCTDLMPFIGKAIGEVKTVSRMRK